MEQGNFRVCPVEDPEGGYFLIEDMRTNNFVVGTMCFSLAQAKEKLSEAVSYDNRNKRA